ncbi:MAG: acyl-CoA dehydrogenase family protein [Balneolaceae bacterium]|nr:acyl-CoA dehydrogenase family protein [Balneolaceae bacterium]
MIDFESFLSEYKQRLSEIFKKNQETSKSALKRGISEDSLTKILDVSPLAAFIPTEYGGYGGNTAEALSMLEASSYQSLPLSLMMGINGALFLQPVANYADESVKKSIYKRVIENNKMGGLMITEPDYGSEALKMQTSYSYNPNKGVYNIQGLKHWAGLTGMADYWLMTARGVDSKGDLGRDISFFIHDTRNGGIEVEEYYNNLGLYMLPYGRNRVNIEVPEDHKLEGKGTGITLMLDLLHRSRLQFPGMGMGFLKRMMEEAVDHCKSRFVGGKNLIDYDQVRNRISKLQSYFTVCSAMCNFTSQHVPLQKNTSRMDVEANAIKSVVTDYMQRASQSLLQLTGAKGYRLDHIAGRSVVDSRPFQIFEGSNDILYQQISESVLKMMRKIKSTNLYDFLKEYELTIQSSDYFKDYLNFEIDAKMPQRKLVQLGRALGRIISMEFTINLGEQGFNRDLVDNALKSLQDEVNELLSSFNSDTMSQVVEDFSLDSSWFNLQLMDAK